MLSRKRWGFLMLGRFLSQVAERARANAGGLRAAPEAFVALAIIAFGISYFGLRQVYGERLAILESKLSSQRAPLAEHRAELRSASPEQAAAQIERLRALAVGTQARGRDHDQQPRDRQ
jgi:hypothetical protein